MEMEQEELNKILSEHKEWRESGGERGERANLGDSDLRCADLSGADLRGADLSGADLMVTNLSRADLRWAKFSKDFDRENLVKALGIEIEE